MTDSKIMIINEKYPEEFENRVNKILKEGGWRVVQTEMYVTDHHYYAMLVKSDKQDEFDKLVERHFGKN